MLNKFKQFLSGNTDITPAQADIEKEVVNMTTATEQPIAADFASTDASADLVAQLATSTSALTELQAAFAELTTKFEEAQADLAVVENEKKELATKAEEARLVARKEKIVAAVGTSQADALMAAVGGLEDAQFNAVVSAMATSREAEANTEAFQEIGVSANADASKVAVEKSALEAKLEEKYRASQHSN
jgi:hypothetical protein